MDLEALRPWNTHWSTGRPSTLVLRPTARSAAAAGSEAFPPPRAAVPWMVKRLVSKDAGEWEIVPGPRQIGKTTSLGHVMRILLEGHSVSPRSIVYVPLDQPAVQASLADDVDGLIEAASTRHAPSQRQPLFLLLDEVQEMDHWARRLKAAWDRHHAVVRVLATGSSAMKLIRPADADFPGRIVHRTMHPLKFREVLAFHPDRAEYVGDEHWDRIVNHAKVARGLLGDAGSYDRLGDELLALHEAIHAPGEPFNSFLRRVLLEYALWGGYPQARPGTARGPIERRDVFEQAWNAVLARDAPGAGIRKTGDFERLFFWLATNPGGKFVPGSISGKLGPLAETISSWKAALEDALLVQQLPAMKSTLRPARGKDKVYLVDPGWYAYFRGITEATLSPEDPSIGFLIENVAVDHVRRLQFSLTGTTTLPIGYVQEPEIDIASSLGRTWLLVESKFRTRPRRTALADRTDKPAEAGEIHVVITRDHFELPSGMGAYHLPAHEWLLLA